MKNVDKADLVGGWQRAVGFGGGFGAPGRPDRRDEAVDTGQLSLSGHLMRVIKDRARSAMVAPLGDAFVVGSAARSEPPAFLAFEQVGVPMEPHRVVLPMCSGVAIRPDHSAQITACPQSNAFRPERVLICGDASRWVVNEIKVGRHSQLLESGELPGEAFSSVAQGAEVLLDRVPTAGNFTMLVTYVGPCAEGEPFLCTAFGTAAVDGSSDEQASRLYLPLSSGVKVTPNASATITAHPQDPFRPERIIIGGRPKDWVINNIEVGNRKQLAQSGDLPGEVFAAEVTNDFVSFETVQAAMQFRITVTYIGEKAEGESFGACAIGTVAG